MKIKSASDVMAVARARGFRIRVDTGPPPMPVLQLPKGVSKDGATEVLMNALRAWRLEIIQEVLAEGKGA